MSIYDKGEFARICVKIDLQQPLLTAFTAFDEDMQLVYEGLQSMCFGCGLYGHEHDKYPHSPVAVDSDNKEIERSSVQVEMGITRGHSEQSMTQDSENRDGPNHKAMEEIVSGGDQKLGVAGNGGAGMAVQRGWRRKTGDGRLHGGDDRH
ncbi:hypothetical protein K1719_000406 [Acacia pycnantha]|nr:hypothetical protein K1719_000406 [Acacia pycnantha]